MVMLSRGQFAVCMGALLKTGTEWNGTEYTGTRRNETKWTRIVPECSGTSYNDTAMKRNECNARVSHKSTRMERSNINGITKMILKESTQ